MHKKLIASEATRFRATISTLHQTAEGNAKSVGGFAIPRPSGGYRLRDGTRVSGVTTILDQWGAKARGLYYWHWEQGSKGAEFGKKLEEEATLGTLVHGLIEAALRKSEPPEIPPEHKERAENAMLGFYEWFDAFNVEVTDTEISLVSETYRYGGTIDYAVRLKGRRAILDLKSGKKVYDDYRVQLAAYAQLWRECHPADPPQGYHLLRVGKEDGSFEHRYWPSLEIEWQIFEHLLALSRLAKALK